MVKSKLWKNLREKHYVHLSRFVRCAASAQVIGVDVVRIRRFGKIFKKRELASQISIWIDKWKDNSKDTS